MLLHCPHFSRPRASQLDSLSTKVVWLYLVREKSGVSPLLFLSAFLIINLPNSNPVAFSFRCSEPQNADNPRGEWCNVAPAGFGIKPGTAVDNPLVDSIVWIKPGGESDGQCGMDGAPRAGQWFEKYAQMLVENADSSIAV